MTVKRRVDWYIFLKDKTTSHKGLCVEVVLRRDPAEFSQPPLLGQVVDLQMNNVLEQTGFSTFTFIYITFSFQVSGWERLQQVEALWWIKQTHQSCFVQQVSVSAASDLQRSDSALLKSPWAHDLYSNFNCANNIHAKNIFTDINEINYSGFVYSLFAPQD